MSKLDPIEVFPPAGRLNVLRGQLRYRSFIYYNVAGWGRASGTKNAVELFISHKWLNVSRLFWGREGR